MDSVIKTYKYSTLFVCTANQCRSPMAEVLFKQYIQTQGYSNKSWMVASAGCWAYPDLSATNNAVQTVEHFGCSLQMHISQAVTELLLQKFNLILCMEADHKTFIKRNFPEHAEKTFRFSEMVREEFDIVDPVGSSIEHYMQTAQEIRTILRTGFEKICTLSN